MGKREIDDVIEKRRNNRPKYNKNNVKRKVLDMLKEKDKTSTEIAEMVGCTRQYVFMIAKEEGVTLPRKRRIPKKKIENIIQELGRTGKYSVKQMAYMTGVDLSYVYISLKKANIKPISETEAKKQKIIELAKTGSYSMKELIGLNLLSDVTIKKIIRQEGIQLPNKEIKQKDRIIELGKTKQYTGKEIAEMTGSDYGYVMIVLKKAQLKPKTDERYKRKKTKQSKVKRKTEKKTEHPELPIKDRNRVIQDSESKDKRELQVDKFTELKANDNIVGSYARLNFLRKQAKLKYEEEMEKKIRTAKEVSIPFNGKTARIDENEVSNLSTRLLSEDFKAEDAEQVKEEAGILKVSIGALISKLGKTYKINIAQAKTLSSNLEQIGLPKSTILSSVITLLLENKEEKLAEEYFRLNSEGLDVQAKNEIISIIRAYKNRNKDEDRIK